MIRTKYFTERYERNAELPATLSEKLTEFFCENNVEPADVLDISFDFFNDGDVQINSAYLTYHDRFDT